MHPRRSVVASALAAGVVAGAVLGGTAGGAVADVGVPLPTLSPLPSVSVAPLPPVPSVPSVPLPTGVPAAPNATASAPAPTAGPGTGSSGPQASGAGGAAVPGTGTARAAAPSVSGKRGRLSAAGRRKRADATPMVAGTDRAKGVLDAESSPQLYAASQQFLRADQAIAAIAQQKRLLARLRQEAADTAHLYRAMGYDVDGARRVSDGWHARFDALPAATSGRQARERRRVEDTATRADERLGNLVVARQRVRADFVALAARYGVAKAALADANARVEQLAAQRTSALQAVRAARGSDVALNRARLAESGQLGAQIEALSEQVQRRGRAVQGTGRFAMPLDGTITSPYGMRFHPILRYTKLHTGTDFAGGSVIHAADDGRVLMTVLSTAYGNFTVIDHGVIDGKHVTTAYAHQARFLVTPGQVVRKGDPIGVVGQTGYATGPHLHFEVREDGTTVDPMRFLAAHR